MAAAAELLQERLPESEVYGRSLSSIHKLGVFMVGKAAPEIITSPEADQVRVEFYTSVEEGFGTDMELGGGLEVRDFDLRPVIDGEVRAKDLKTAVSAITASGLKRAVISADEDERFNPQLTRSRLDHENALWVDKMAQGVTGYNTRIVVSPFPEEAAQQSGNKYWQDIGYVPHLKRGFVQLFHKTEEGVLAGSLSFDGSNKERLRNVFAVFGVEIPETEITDNWLKYAITRTLTEDEAKSLAIALADSAADPSFKKSTNTVDVTRKYKNVMDRAFDGSYIHVCESLALGYQTPGTRSLVYQLADKAHLFNERYASALYAMRKDQQKFGDHEARVLHELLVYSTIEMMRALHLRKAQIGSATPDHFASQIPLEAQHINPLMFQKMLSSFGAEGAKENRTYSACGLSISLGGKDNFDIMDGPQTAFGGALGGGGENKQDTQDDECEFISKECPKCGEKNVKTVSTKSHISGSCGCKVKK